MNDAAIAPDAHGACWRSRGRIAVWAGWLLALAGAAVAQVSTPAAVTDPASAPSTAASMAPTRASAPRVASRPLTVESGASWQDLTPLQKDFLQPLQQHWSAIDVPQKRKWMALTLRVPKMSADERDRIQARMIEWARLTPEQRGQARLRYQEVKQMPLPDRQARWAAYQSLAPERRQQLADLAARAASAPVSRRPGAAANASASAARDVPLAKSNIVPSHGPETRPRQVGPTLVQARPGATTTLITRSAAPPSHQQSGMPKIAATPEFVNKSTLLPRHGPQAASTRAAAAPASAAVGPDRR